VSLPESYPPAAAITLRRSPVQPCGGKSALPALSVAPEHLRGSCQPGSIRGGRFTGIQNKEGPLLRPSVRSDIFNLWIGYLDPRVSGE